MSCSSGATPLQNKNAYDTTEYNRTIIRKQIGVFLPDAVVFRYLQYIANP